MENNINGSLWEEPSNTPLPTYEITAVDHVNQHMLSVFKQHFDSGNVKIFEEHTTEADNDPWDDDYNYADDIPTQQVIMAEKDIECKEQEQQPQQD